jgi:hypothetical protein
MRIAADKCCGIPFHHDDIASSLKNWRDCLGDTTMRSVPCAKELA